MIEIIPIQHLDMQTWKKLKRFHQQNFRACNFCQTACFSTCLKQWTSVEIILYLKNHTAETFFIDHWSCIQRLCGIFLLTSCFQATHWNHGFGSERIRQASFPPLTQKFWTDEFNRILKKEYNLKNDLQSIFLDTFYHRASTHEINVFNNNSQILLDFAHSRKPFHCEIYIYTFFPYLSFNHLGKDIEIALTEIREQQNALYDLKRKDESKTKVIGNLSQENYRLSE